ncbi:MAG TPA: adenylate/guanylate cyclase domain-containing protein [Methylomirabilota bacterium]|nr:adenylate/guanylate cyclase domain-containing protein [Methylomirabilota bacterium]
MRCSGCDKDNAPGVKFCGGCGARLDLPCPACQAMNPAGNRFCNACGTSLGASRSEAPDSYTPGHLAQKIRSSRESLAGERKQVTVLFADLKGSLELLAERDPEDARALLDAVLEDMMEAVHRYEGTVNQVMGDGIMALFGAPLACEDHAVRACYAALRMHRRVAGRAEEFRRRLGVEVQIRVGLNSGEVVVRSIGNDLQMDYSAVGQTTHLAARMEQLARPGGTLITSATRRLADRAIEADAQGPMLVKGLREPVEVWELRRAAGTSSSLTAGAGGLTPMLGRVDDLARIEALRARVVAGRGQLALIAGEPGIGKSRLLLEALRTAAADGWRTIDGACVSYGTPTPYLPVRALLVSYFQVDDEDDARRIREKVAARLLALDPTLATAVSPILAVGNVPTEDAEWAALEPSARRQRIFRAVRDVLLKESEQAPVVIAVENLQWADSETQALLDYLAEQLREARVLLIVSARPDYVHDWPAGAAVTVITLEPLTTETANALVDQMLGEAPDLVPLKRRLVEHTEGNPFFLEESVRALVETRALVGHPGDFHLLKPVDGIQIPDRVQAVLAARIDRLGLSSKGLLQAGAAVGHDVPVALLQAIVEVPPDDVMHGLTELEAAGFLRATALYPDLAYSFKQAITLDVAYASLLKDQRRALHARILGALESAYPGARRAEHVERLADHALRAEAWAKAIVYLRDAGDRAVARSANKEAAGFYEKALRSVQQLPQRPETLAAAIDIRLDLRPPLLQLGRLDDIHRLSKEAETLARQLGDEERLARAYTYLVNYHYLLGETARTIEYGERCLAIAARRDDPTLAMLARRYLGHSHHARGEHRLAVDVLEANLTALESQTVTDVAATTGYVASCGWLAWALADQGEFDRADAVLDRARTRAEDARHPYSQAIAWTLTGLVWRERGQLDRALAPLSRSVDLCEQATLPVWQPVAAALLGSTLVALDRKDDGHALLHDAIRRAEALGVMAYLARWTVLLGEALLARGDAAGALATADRAIALSLAHGERGHEALAWRLIGDVHARGGVGDLTSAREAYGQALALAEELGLRPLIARTHAGLGRVARRLGHLEDAEAHVAHAVVLFADMGMRAALAEAEPELKALGHLVIVARSNVDLFEYLTRQFAGDPEIILDRRQGAAPRTGPAERRHHAVDTALRTRGLAVVIPQ